MDSIEKKVFADELYQSLDRYHLGWKVLASRLKDAITNMGMFFHSGHLWWYNGNRYVTVNFRELRNSVMQVCDRLDRGVGIAFLNSIVQMLFARADMLEPPCDPLTYIAFKNGTINLTKQRFVLSKPRKEVFASRYIDLDYDVSARCPLWEMFLDEVLPDKSLQALLQEFLGAIFIDRTKSKIETMLWLFGNGANGKSVVFDTIVGVLGVENVSQRELADFCHKQKGGYALSDIDGKLLNYCSDVQGQYTFSDTAKKIISGEPTYAERKYERARLITQIPLMMANCNTLPKIQEKSNAWARRIKIIPFTYTIPEEKQDKELANKLLQEKVGIFNWIMEGRKRFIEQQYHFTPAPQADAMMASFQTAGFEVINFMQEENFTSLRLHNGDDGKNILTRDLYAVYRSWLTTKNAPDYAFITQAQFTKKLKQFGFIPFHSYKGSTIKCYSLLNERKIANAQKKVAANPDLTVPHFTEEEGSKPIVIATKGESVMERLNNELQGG